MAVNEFVLTSSYVQISSAKSTVTATEVASGRQGNIQLSHTIGGLIPFSRILQPSDQIYINTAIDYFARTLDSGGMTIRVEDDT